MSVYFDVVKLVFFILTIFVALFHLRLKGVLSSSIVESIGPYIMPVYFIFLGLIIGYIIGYIFAAKHENKQDEKDYIMGFIIGGLIGVALSAGFYFIAPTS